MTEWKPIETAPKDDVVLLFGALIPRTGEDELHANPEKPRRFVGYWCEIDEAWTPSSGTWLGPWLKPTHWMPLPNPPSA